MRQAADEPVVTAVQRRSEGRLVVERLAEAHRLRVQLLPTPSLDSLPVGDGEEGITSLSAGAVSDAVRRELEASPDISSARVRLVGNPDDLALDIRATVAAGADQDRVRRHIENEVLPRAAGALEAPDLDATVRLRLGEAAQRAVA